MNLRIQELLKQTGVTDNWNKADWYSMSPEMIEKFAQLIVVECVAIANRQFSAATGLDDRDCLTAQQMKQHFGVEP